jgi:hypothetical protein
VWILKYYVYCPINHEEPSTVQNLLLTSLLKLLLKVNVVVVATRDVNFVGSNAILKEGKVCVESF